MVGGGIAGVSCAEMLSILCPREKTVLVSCSKVVKAVSNLSNLTKLIATFDISEETAEDFEARARRRSFSSLSAPSSLEVAVLGKVSHVDQVNKRLITTSGDVIRYRFLCLCHGARPKLLVPSAVQEAVCSAASSCPEAPNLDEFVLGIRDTESVETFRERLKGARRIVVVGNGGIATELVHELDNVVDVVWAIKDDSISATFVDAGAAEFFLDHLRNRGDKDAASPTTSTSTTSTRTTKVATTMTPKGRLKGRHLQGDDGQPVTKRARYTVDDEVPAMFQQVRLISAEEGPSSTKLGGAALGPDWLRAGLTFPSPGSSSGRHGCKIEYSCEVKSLLSPVQLKNLGKASEPWSGSHGRSGSPETSNCDDIDEDKDWKVYVELTNGRVYGCDFLVSATGVVPNGDAIKRLAEDGRTLKNFDLAEDGSLIVNERMQVRIAGRWSDDIYAAGDVCSAGWDHSEHWFQMRLWTQARQMGLFAGQCMFSALETPDKPVEPDFCFEMFTHATRFFGFKVILLGLFNGQKGIDYEALVRVTRGKEYIKCVMSRGCSRMQGAILVGETDLEETFENLILNQTDLSVYGADLLDPNIDIEDYFD